MRFNWALPTKKSPILVERLLEKLGVKNSNTLFWNLQRGFCTALPYFVRLFSENRTENRALS